MGGTSRWQYDKLLAKDFSSGIFGMFSNVDAPYEIWIYSVRADGLIEHVVDAKGEGRNHFWHVANAFERGGRVIVDASAGSGIDFDGVTDVFRFDVDIVSRTVSRRRLRSSEDGCEFCNVNPQFLKREHRFVYGVSKSFQEGSYLVKIDAAEVMETASPEDRIWGPFEGLIASEPVMVPRPGAVEEDDGVVLSVVLDKLNEASFLLVLDAQTMEEVARVAAPHVVNLGLHSHWFQPGMLTRV